MTMIGKLDGDLDTLLAGYEITEQQVYSKKYDESKYFTFIVETDARSQKYNFLDRILAKASILTGSVYFETSGLIMEKTIWQP